MGNTKIRIKAVNRLNIERQENFEDSVFRETYERAEGMVCDLIERNKELQTLRRGDKDSIENEENEYVYNVISFLGERGMGKTSAMLSFAEYLRTYDSCRITGTLQWGKMGERKKGEAKNAAFQTLGCIDATMLEKKESILDVILAKMWDIFDDMSQKRMQNVDELYESLEKQVKQSFKNVRKAYLGLRQLNNDRERRAEHIPALSELHDLAVSMNLRTELCELVNSFLKIISYDRDKYREKEHFLVIPIDDLDMGADNSQKIIEEIKRFFTIANVIVLLTADIKRLKRVCAHTYGEIYKGTEQECHRFVNDYLEKVLPSNMRLYMPELKEFGGVIRQEYQLDFEDGNNCSEKDYILNSIYQKAGFMLDKTRGMRHFLQHDSFRSLVNYLNEMKGINSEDEMLIWLQNDLRYRLTDRIPIEEQKQFIEMLFKIDYTDLNTTVITYLRRSLGKQGMQTDDLDGIPDSLGMVLYYCGQMEEQNVENRQFVNCIILLYAVLIRRMEVYDKGQEEKNAVLKALVGRSLFGGWEYKAIIQEDQSVGYNKALTIERLDLELSFSQAVPDAKENVLEIAQKIIEKNRVKILGWIYAMMFVHMDEQESKNVIIEHRYSNTSNTEVKRESEEERGQDGKEQADSVQTEMPSETDDTQIILLKVVGMNVEVGVFSFLVPDEKKVDKIWILLKRYIKEFVRDLCISRKCSVEGEEIEKCCANILAAYTGLEKKLQSGIKGIEASNTEIIYTIGKTIKRGDGWGKPSPEAFVQNCRKLYMRLCMEYDAKIQAYPNQGEGHALKNNVIFKLFEEQKEDSGKLSAEENKAFWSEFSRRFYELFFVISEVEGEVEEMRDSVTAKLVKNAQPASETKNNQELTG